MLGTPAVRRVLSYLVNSFVMVVIFIFILLVGWLFGRWVDSLRWLKSSTNRENVQAFFQIILRKVLREVFPDTSFCQKSAKNLNNRTRFCEHPQTLIEWAFADGR